MDEVILTDEQLIQHIQKGDRTAFRTLFDRYYKELLGTAINMLKDINSAKDVTQEVFLQIWKKRENLTIQTSVGAYLKRAVINRSLNFIKAKKNVVDESHVIHLSSTENSANEKLAAQDIETAMKRALDTLPDRCRTIFIMKRLEGYSLKEIAQQLDISPKTVENQITKALKVLQKAIRPFLEEKKDST